MANNRFRVLLLGYGEMGHAMEYLLGEGHRLTIWQRRPRAGMPAIDLEQAARQAEVILFCLPAPPHAELATRLASALSPDAICVTVAKGLDDQARTAAEALHEALGTRRHIGVLYGPMIAEELRAGCPGFAELGILADDGFGRLSRLFAGTALRLRRATDVTGLSWCAVLKNVYAMLFGIADELGLGDNTRGFLTVMAVAEMREIVARLGGEAATSLGLAGLGDLVTTATSRGSHHHELGRRLARGERGTLVGEGLHTLKVLRRHTRFDPRPFALLRLIDACASDRRDIRVRIDELLRAAS